MNFYEIEFIQGGEKKKIIISAENKLEAIKNFRARGEGVFLSMKDAKEPLVHKINRLKKM